jgi:hypothetical protein
MLEFSVASQLLTSQEWLSSRELLNQGFSLCLLIQQQATQLIPSFLKNFGKAQTS